MTTACPRAPRDERNRGKNEQQTDPHSEDKKQKAT